MRYPWRTSFAVMGSAIATIVSTFLGPFIIAGLLDQLQHGSITLHGSAPIIIAYALTQIYGQIIGWRINLYFTWTMQTAAQRDLYKQIFSTLTMQSLTFHADRFGGALVSQTTKLVGAFERFWDTVIFQIVPSLSGIMTATIILSFIFWQYAVFLGVFSLLFIMTVTIGSRFLAKRNKEEAQANTATNAYVADAVTNVVTIKSHGHEEQELDALLGKTSYWRHKSLSTMKGFLGVSTAYSSLIAVIHIGALVGAIWASEHSLISIGTIYLTIMYTTAVCRQLWEMNSIMRQYNKIIGDAHDMTEILQLTPEVVNRTDTPLAVSQGEVRFDGVVFAHDGSHENLFNSFSLTIKPGEKVGLVGHSGSGKTTLARLLLRFSDIQGGKITVDEQNIADVTQESLRRQIAYVPQEPMLFHRSLQENIAYGKPSASQEDIHYAAKQANALEFIEELPHGFETLVGERGVKLSGGQRQRIALARAILKDAPILVLDEATSALDSASERLIQDALEKLMQGRTSIVIAHRLSTIAKLDRIIVLDHGVIREQGTHRELLQHAGIYATLWAHQSGGFIEE